MAGKGSDGCLTFIPWQDKFLSLVFTCVPLTVQVSKAHSWTCMDLYIFATPYRVTWDYYFLSREHTLEFKEWESEQEYEYVSSNHLLILVYMHIS